jgi:NAD-dependent deacetylase
MATTPDFTSHRAIVDLLGNARRIVVMTGAGMSADSGIPTFRGAQSGLWARFDPAQLATPGAYHADKALVWGWYRWRTSLVEQARPHAGHRAIAALERMKPGLAVVTQNVDDLHERAGSSDVIHLHGSLFALRCFACARPHPHEPGSLATHAEPDLRVDPPTCLHCGGSIRPGVVWFGEQLPERAWRQARRLMETCDALLIVGTSGVVQPAASLPEIARQAGTPIIEVNPERSALTPVADVFCAASAAESLPRVVGALRAA